MDSTDISAEKPIQKRRVRGETADRRRLLKARADIQEMEAKRRAGQQVDIGVFERTIVQLVSIYRQRMLCVPANVAPMVAAETDIAKCHAIIEASVYEAMEDFSRTELEIEDPGSVRGSDPEKPGNGKATAEVDD